MEAEAQAVETSSGMRQPGGQDFGFESGDIGCVDQGMVNCRDGVLPDQVFCGDFRTEVAALGSHVAVGQLEPGAGEGIGKGLRVLVEAARDRLVDRVKAQ